jgi:DNA-nicking Smr family endonuclease
MSDDSLSNEDKALFRAAIGQVKPLKTSKLVPNKPSKPNSPLRKSPLIKNTPEPSTRFLSDFTVEEVSSNTVLSYCQSSLPKSRLQDLIRGRIPWKAKLDLHGFRVDEVGPQLSAFIEHHYTIGTRSILIIHGRGGHNNAPPILKNRINRYLPQFDEVLAFHSALPKDGGLGAVYVLLKRQRD